MRTIINSLVILGWIVFGFMLGWIFGNFANLVNEKTVNVDCLTEQSRAVDFKGSHWISRDFYNECRSRGIIVETKIVE